MIELTRPGKNTLIVTSPVMIAAGIAGFGNHYHDLINLSKLGALITNPIAVARWSPSRGTRVVPLQSGVLVHTGYPGGGLASLVREYRAKWAASPVPIVLHLLATTPDDMKFAAEVLDREDSIAAVELGLLDDKGTDSAHTLVQTLTSRMDKPVLVRLPMYDAYEIAETCADAGAGALVVAAPPRGTARDVNSGKLMSGRVYSPLLQPMILRMVGQLRQRIDPEVPIIGAGGIHSLQDARDFMDVGAAAVQVDSLLWIQPNIVERIARDLTGGLTTRMIGAMPDEWHPDMGDTEFRELFGTEDDDPAQSGG